MPRAPKTSSGPVGDPELQALSGTTIIITGAGGNLGGWFARILKAEVPGARTLALPREQLDVTDRDAVLRLKDERPQIIIHCAAKVNGEYCETHPEESYNIKVNGTKNIIELARLTGAKVFYPQSFFIYDGKTLPIDESTRPAPLNVYGWHKLESELLLRECVARTLVVRMGGFFGGCEKDKNFVGNFARRLAKIMKEGASSEQVGDRVWQPTFTKDLAYNSLLLLARQKEGVYIMASPVEASFYDIACEMTRYLKLEEKMTIKPVSAAVFNAQENARRPQRATLINRRLQAEGLDRQRVWTEALHEYLDEPYFEELFRGLR